MSEQRVDRNDTLLLTSEDRAKGFSIVSDDYHNVTVLKRGKPFAWFSSRVTGELLREFLKLAIDYEKSGIPRE